MTRPQVPEENAVSLPWEEKNEGVTPNRDALKRKTIKNYPPIRRVDRKRFAARYEVALRLT